MHVLKNSKGIGLQLEEAEMDVLIFLLKGIILGYEKLPDTLNPSAHSHVYLPKGILENGYEQDHEFWSQHFLSLKQERFNLVTSWLLDLTSTVRKKKMVWKLAATEIDSFLQIMNDRRLFLAAQENITELEMDHSFLEKLEPVKKDIVTQIHLLSVVMEIITATMDDD